MNIKKKSLGKLEKCYAVDQITEEDGNKIVFVSESEKKACLFNEKWEKEEIILPKTGIMTIRKWPSQGNKTGFIHSFFPGFQAQKSGLMIMEKVKGQWKFQSVLELPFLHRFEIFVAPWGNQVILSVLCSDKKGREDWNFPGYLAAIPLNKKGEFIFGKGQILLNGLHKNHGLWKGNLQGRSQILTASQEGIHRIAAKDKTGEWEICHLIKEPSGEAAAFDLDGDGKEEILSISPFHGDHLFLYKEIEGQWKKIWSCEETLEFTHSLWAGLWNKKRVCFCGCRRGPGSLLAVFYENGRWMTQKIDTGAGSSNLFVANWMGKDLLFSANHSVGECAVYFEE